jgi:uncharacterized protein YutE (UPF0331/DUF86 family)
VQRAARRSRRTTRVQDRVDRNAQLLAQGAADVALHVVAASGTSPPETYAEALLGLATLGVIAPDLAARLAAAGRLRNILVHGYLEIDHGRLYDELDWIEDTATFASAGERWLASQP